MIGSTALEGEPPFGKNVTCCGAVAAAALPDVTLTVIPCAGAEPDNVSTKFSLVAPTIVRLCGAYVTVAVTRAGAVAVPYPDAVAVIVTSPMSRPEAVAGVVGVVWPAAKVSVVGAIATFDGSLLDSVSVSPLDGAGVPSVTGNAADVLSPVVRLAGRLIDPGALTVTSAVAAAILGVAVVAVIVAGPGATGVTGTVTLFWFAGIVTEDGTVATPVFEDARLKVTAEGAAVDRVSERFCAPVPFTIVIFDGKNAAEALT